MARPSLNVRLREFTAQVDTLQTWNAAALTSRVWSERLNELRFVRATLAWEDFLEQSFICYLRGCRSILGQSYALVSSAATSLASAQAMAIGSNNHFGKWLNESWTISRANAVFQGIHPYHPLASPTFPVIRKIRNRIVHRSDNVRNEFRTVIINVYGTQRPGVTPGRLLTDVDNGLPRIDNYLNLLKATATLITN